MRSFTGEYVAVFACTQTTVLRVLSDFLKRKVNLRGSDRVRGLEGLEVIKFLPNVHGFDDRNGWR